jgi:hypothetical protein
VEAREMPQHRAPRAHARRPFAVGLEQRRRLPVEEIEHAPRRDAGARRRVGGVVARGRKAGGHGLSVDAVGALDEAGWKGAEERPHEGVVERWAHARILEVEKPPAARGLPGVAGRHVAVGERRPLARTLHELRQLIHGLVRERGGRLPQRAQPGGEVAPTASQRHRRRRRRRHRPARQRIALPVELRGERAHRHMQSCGEPRDVEQGQFGVLPGVGIRRVEQLLQRRRHAQILDEEAARLGVPAEEAGRHRRRDPRRGEERQRRPLVQPALRLGLEALHDDRRGKVRAARDPRAPHVVPRPRLEERGRLEAHGAARSCG